MTTPGARLRQTADRASRLFRLPLKVHLTLAHALVVFTVVELTIRQTRIDRLAGALGVSVDLRPSATSDQRLPIEALPLDARRQLRCAQRIADVWPFHDGPCLRVALVGGHLVRRLDPTIRLGLRPGASSVIAHAWLEVDGRPLEDVASYARFELPRTERQPEVDPADVVEMSRAESSPGSRHTDGEPVTTDPDPRGRWRVRSVRP